MAAKLPRMQLYDACYKINENSIVLRVNYAVVWRLVWCKQPDKEGVAADVGDRAWSAELPKDAVQDMKEAKGTIYQTADQPWW